MTSPPPRAGIGNLGALDVHAVTGIEHNGCGIRTRSIDVIQDHRAVLRDSGDVNAVNLAGVKGAVAYVTVIRGPDRARARIRDDQSVIGSATVPVVRFQSLIALP